MKAVKWREGELSWTEKNAKMHRSTVYGQEFFQNPY